MPRVRLETIRNSGLKKNESHRSTARSTNEREKQSGVQIEHGRVASRKEKRAGNVSQHNKSDSDFVLLASFPSEAEEKKKRDSVDDVQGRREECWQWYCYAASTLHTRRTHPSLRIAWQYCVGMTERRADMDRN